MADKTSSDPPPGDESSAEEIEKIKTDLGRIEAGERLPRPTTWDEYRDGFILWLTHHWGAPDERECPVCGSTDWGIAEVVELRTSPPWPIAADSNHGVYPMGQVVCYSCGYTRLINVLFIFEMDEPE